MSSKGTSSLKELKSLREAVLAEEKARTQALMQNLPQSQTELARAAAAAAAAIEDTSNTIIPMTPAISAENSAAPAPKPPLNQKSGGPAAPSPGSRGKASKESALIIPLTPKIQERLQRNVENSRWSPAELVMELIRVSLHRGYPEILFGHQSIARAGTYRTFERNPFETTLKIVSGQGVFNVGVNPASAEYQRWLAYFVDQAVASPEKAACQVCLFALQSYLENVDDFTPDAWTKVIPEENFVLNKAI